MYEEPKIFSKQLLLWWPFLQLALLKKKKKKACIKTSIRGQ